MNQGVAPGINTGIPLGRNGPGINTSGSPYSRQGPNSGEPLRDPFASLQLATAKAKATSRVKPQAPPKHPPGTPFVFTDYARYTATQPSYGKGSCVDLPKHLYPEVGATALWRQGPAVQGNTTILPGTLIATFETDGRYKSHPKNNHAGIYVRQDDKFIYIFDQWNGKSPEIPVVRPVSLLGKRAKPITYPSGVVSDYDRPSDNGSAFFIIVH